MHTFRINYKRLSFCILICSQTLLIASYFLFRTSAENRIFEKIKFTKITQDATSTRTYRTLTDDFHLKTVNSREFFIDFNSSVCFLAGTDLKSMRNSNEINWKCICLPGWHGTDCGQPEVLWRALLAYKKPTTLKGPRVFQRRLIYVFEAHQFNEDVVDIRLNELGDIVDLFVLFESGNGTESLRHNLNNKFGKEHQDKILYMQGNLDNLWKSVAPHLRNLHKDDLVVTSNIYEIPNRNALMFMKFYDNFPQPIKFRLRWSVFGFFWLHPRRTVLSGGACTISFLKEVFNDNLTLLFDNRTLLSPLGIILGDLNHTGGWFCQFCTESTQVVRFLASKTNKGMNLDWQKIAVKKIDKTYIEEMIENGLYIDGKTELIRAHKYSDKYFAPTYVIEHDWKYDFLLINFFSKMDYYER